METQKSDGVVCKHHMDKPFLRYLTAGVLAISLHMTFLFFSEIPDADMGVVANVKYVTLLPLNAELPSDKKLLEWMKIMDPMSVTKPDRKNGFSITPAKFYPGDEEINLKKHFSHFKKGEFRPLPVPVERRKDKIKRFWEYSTASTRSPSFSIVKRAEGDYPLWVCEDGTLLPQLFHHIKEVNALLAKQKKVISETVLRTEFRGSGFFPRIKIDVSCGNPELDRLAIKTLSLKGGRFFDKKNLTSDPDFIAIKWKK